MNDINKCVLILSCNDQKGLVYKLTNFIYKIGGNITDLDEHVDQQEEYFFVRIAFDVQNKSKIELKEKFSSIGKEINASWDLFFSEERVNTVIYVSKYDHCLQEILWRNTLNEFNINIKGIISNHNDLEQLANQHKIPYYHFEISNQTKMLQEQKQLKLLKELNTDLIVLARYMQILSPEFVQEYKNKIINIHHSFLPAFIGGNPYKQAFLRGVKIIGATSHYVTEELDEGPIIEQDITRITHKDSLRDLIRKGRDLERMVLAKSILLHSQHRILIKGKKTIVFD